MYIDLHTIQKLNLLPRDSESNLPGDLGQYYVYANLPRDLGQYYVYMYIDLHTIQKLNLAA